MSITNKTVALSVIVFTLVIVTGLLIANRVQAEEPEQTQINNLLTNYFNALKDSDVGVMKYCY